MPPLPGFSDNPFLTRSDLIRAALALIQPLDQYKSPSGARIKLATGTGTGFSETAAQLEGYARPLWVVADLLRLNSATENADLPSIGVQLDSWITGLKAGIDPQSPEYWGSLSNVDQRMVEMESIAYALLVFPNAFNLKDDEEARKNLIDWLQQINHHKMPQNNWLWFRVLVNLALVRTLEVPLLEVKKDIDESLELLDAFYLGEGWSSDGFWGDERKQTDYYSGSFAIQFAQLLFVRFAPDYDSERTRRYVNQAKEFAIVFWRYFSPEGAAIPFGRSLTYRFAFAAFWSAVAAAGVELPTPLAHPGIIKGMVLRHLRWWSKHPNIFNTDGTPNIGYAYPNMHMAEDYNSPQSVFWCLKTFIVVGLGDSDSFWASKEMPHPMTTISSCKLKGEDGTSQVQLARPPRHMLCNTAVHHFLLSSGQSTRKRFRGREAKYGKFAYSSAFTFSVPCGQFLEQVAPDSTLAVSSSSDEEDPGWKVRWDPYDVRSEIFQFEGHNVPTLMSSWRPWKHLDLTIRTRLIPPLERWPGWHLRVHQVFMPEGTLSKASISAPNLRICDGGFATSTQTGRGDSLYEQEMQAIGDITTTRANPSAFVQYGLWKSDRASLVISESGASGLIDLTEEFVAQSHARTRIQKQSQSLIIKADPNTNLISPRTLIPAIQHTFQRDDDVQAEQEETARLHQHQPMFWLVTGVFAIEASAGEILANANSLWVSRPTGSIEISEGGDGRVVLGD